MSIKYLFNKQKEVVLISHGFQSNYEKGFANGLANNNVRVNIISSDTTDYLNLHTSIKTTNLRGSQKVNRSKLDKIINILSYNIKLFLYIIQQQKSNYHVIGLTMPPLLYGIIWGIVLRFISKKYILTVHNLLPHGRHTIINKFLFKFTYLLPHSIIVHTNKMAVDLKEQYSIPLTKIIVMEHGLEPIAALNKNITKNNEVIQLLFFGSVSEYKGLDLLIEALKNIDHLFHLTISGVCRDVELKKKLEYLIKTHPYRQCITWNENYISEGDIPFLFNNADILVLPYRHIDQSGVLFQGLRYGVPILASRVGSFMNYVSENIGETFLPNDVNDLVVNLNKLIQRLKLNSISRTEIYEYSLKFSWKTTVRNTINCYY